jgi:hypothetical protein
MLDFRRVLSVFAAIGLFVPATFAQSKEHPAAVLAPAKTPSPAVNNDFIRKQFGESCSLVGGPQQFEADLDGDGNLDLLVAARCTNPIADQAEFAFKVIDPYNAFMGFGDVRVTSTFASDAPERRGLGLLIIHGAEKDGWRAETPKSKFVMINLPLKTLTVKKYALKKKTVLGIFMEERGEGESTSSVIFWDGKKYRYQQLGATLE